MLKFEQVSDALMARMAKEKEDGSYVRLAFPNESATRRHPSEDDKLIWRSAFMRDIDKILYCPHYNRCADKTQVFSFYKNDDITRRSLHVQMVSRIARTIGSALHLNVDLIEAIALGHDIGHPPFGHTGEKYLDQLYFEHAGRHFYHNIHSVRVLDKLYPYNLSLQVLSGIASHNGEQELEVYTPKALPDFETFDEQMERCYTDRAFAARLSPATLEACVVRISDIIAYLGKDRQDAEITHVTDASAFDESPDTAGTSEIINDLVVNIIENSYGQPYIKLDHEHFTRMRTLKQDNYAAIYNHFAKQIQPDLTIRPMMATLYEKLLSDLLAKNYSSPIYKHHINDMSRMDNKRSRPYESEEPNTLVVDYIASMTDDYFIDLYRYLFPDKKIPVEYKGYFD